VIITISSASLLASLVIRVSPPATIVRCLSGRPGRPGAIRCGSTNHIPPPQSLMRGNSGSFNGYRDNWIYFRSIS